MIRGQDYNERQFNHYKVDNRLAPASPPCSDATAHDQRVKILSHMCWLVVFCFVLYSINVNKLINHTNRI